MIAFLCVQFRLTAALALLPLPTGHGRLPFPVAMALSAALALLITPVTWTDDSAPPSDAWLVAILVVEVAIGLSMGFCAVAVLSVFDILGRIIGMSVFDRPADAMRSLYMMTGMAVFMVLDGHHLVIRALTTSLRLLPPGAGFHVASNSMDAFVSAMAAFIGAAFSVGTALALPVAVTAVVCESFWSLATRLFPGAAPGDSGVLIRRTVGFLVAGLTLGTALSVAGMQVVSQFESLIAAMSRMRP